MKKIKYILFTAVILSFFFITACSTTQSVPQNDVYYSTTPHNNVTTTTASSQQEAKQTDKATYRQGKVENISQPTEQTTSGGQYNVNYSARLKSFHQSNDTSLNNNNNSDTTAQSNNQQSTTTTIVTPSFSLSLGFGSPYFGSSWSFGFGSYLGWDTGFGWGYPGWGGGYYGWGYPGWGGGYYGWGYPGWGGSYYGWGYYPPYYGYYPSYWGWGYSDYGWGYSDYGYRGAIYQHRMRRGGGSFIPRGEAVGGSGVFFNRNSKSAHRNTGVPGVGSRKRVPVNPEGPNGKPVRQALCVSVLNWPKSAWKRCMLREN